MDWVSVHNETNEEAPEPKWQALFESLDEELGRAPKPVSIIFVSKDKSAELNSRYRGTESATNVLSFEELREIFISPSVVKEEAVNSAVDYSDWMTRIIVHGILHLEGFKHDNKDDELLMEETEKRVLNKLGISLL